MALIEEEEMITISKTIHDELVRDSYFLNCLEACGVDNWCGFEEAQEMMEDEEEQE